MRPARRLMLGLIVAGLAGLVPPAAFLAATFAYALLYPLPGLPDGGLVVAAGRRLEAHRRWDDG